MGAVLAKLLSGGLITIQTVACCNARVVQPEDHIDHLIDEVVSECCSSDSDDFDGCEACSATDAHVEAPPAHVLMAEVPEPNARQCQTLG